MLGAIEAGGTKFVCAVADSDLNIKARVRIPTATPEESIPQILLFFSHYQLEGIGIGAFGPIGINPDAPDYGFVRQTPKPGWTNFDFLGTISSYVNCPIYWTTDVNVAAYGELKRGAAQGLNEVVYLTVGTGIGGGIIHEGKIYSGYSHPEVGHIAVRPPLIERDNFRGVCPYHDFCLEGMASGPAIAARAGRPATELGAHDVAWQIEAYYLAQAAVDYTLMFAPERIIFGGGVSNQKQLYHLIRESFTTQLHGYVQTPPENEYLVHAGLGDDAGITGALLLARQVASNQDTAAKYHVYKP